MDNKELEEAAEEYVDNNVFCDNITDFELEITKKAFIAGAKWIQEQMEELKDFETWKEWKNS